MEGGECQQDVAAATTCQRGMEMCVCVCVREREKERHYVKTSNRSRSICNGPLTPVTSTQICNGGCLAPVTYKCVRTTPRLASTTPVTNVDFW
jgi:hypothetical protein